MEISELKTLLQEKRPNSWDDIPDIDLYKDQVLSYMERQLMDTENGESLTGAMINNYVKQKVMPKPEGKKYSRDHIAYLTMIAMLKQVVSVGDVKTLLDSQSSADDIKPLYEKFCGVLGTELEKTNGLIEEDLDEAALSDLALRLAISSYADKLACESIIKILSEGEDENDKKKK